MIKRRIKPRRVSVARDPKYLEFLREHGWCPAYQISPCRGRIEAAHGPVNGMGSKGSDLNCVPLCSKHHRVEHAVGPMHFWTDRGLNRTWFVNLWNSKYREEMTDDESSK